MNSDYYLTNHVELLYILLKLFSNKHFSILLKTIKATETSKQGSKHLNIQNIRQRIDGIGTKIMVIDVSSINNRPKQSKMSNLVSRYINL